MVEKSLEDSSIGDLNKNVQWVDFNEHDRDGFASFLSGDDFADQHLHYDSESSIMRRFLDSTSASGFDDKSDEIVELKSEEIEHSKMNGVKHLNGNKLRKIGSHSRPLAYASSVSLQVLTGDKDTENSYMVSGAQDLEVDTSKNKIEGSQGRIDILRFSNNIWSAFRSKLARSFTKRIKDGEMTNDCIMDVERGPLLQNNHTRMGLASSFSICERMSFARWASTVISYIRVRSFMRLFQRFQYFVQYNRFPVQLTAAIFVTLTILGLLVFRAT